MLCLVGDRAYEEICNMGFPQCILVGSACTRSIWNDSVEVSRLCVNEVKPLGLQDGLFLYLGTFRGDILGYRWQ